jgi:hypothetical protein
MLENTWREIDYRLDVLRATKAAHKCTHVLWKKLLELSCIKKTSVELYFEKKTSLVELHFEKKFSRVILWEKKLLELSCILKKKLHLSYILRKNFSWVIFWEKKLLEFSCILKKNFSWVIFWEKNFLSWILKKKTSVELYFEKQNMFLFHVVFLY